MNTVGCCEIVVSSVCVEDGYAKRKTKVFTPDPSLSQRWYDQFLLSSDDEQEYIKQVYRRVQRAKSLQNLSPLKEVRVRGVIDSKTKQRMIDTLLDADHVLPVLLDKGWCYYLDWLTPDEVELKRVRQPSRDELKVCGMSVAEFVLNNVKRGTMTKPRSESSPKPVPN